MTKNTIKSNNKNKKLYILVGPSGSGKTTLAHFLKDQGFTQVLSTTTRSPRSGEVQNKDYHFISHKDFENKIQNNEFIEYAQFNKDYYGIENKNITKAIESSKINKAVCVVEIQGYRNLKKQKNVETIGIFLNVPLEVLKDRLNKRDFSQKEERLQKIQEEQKNLEEMKNSGALILESPKIEDFKQILADLQVL